MTEHAFQQNKVSETTHKNSQQAFCLLAIKGMS